MWTSNKIDCVMKPRWRSKWLKQHWNVSPLRNLVFDDIKRRVSFGDWLFFCMLRCADEWPSSSQRREPACPLVSCVFHIQRNLPVAIFESQPSSLGFLRHFEERRRRKKISRSKAVRVSVFVSVSESVSSVFASLRLSYPRLRKCALHGLLLCCTVAQVNRTRACVPAAVSASPTCGRRDPRVCVFVHWRTKVAG